MNELEKKREKRLAERAGIHALEDLMFSIPDEEKDNIEEMISHFFAPGVYARMCLIKKGHIAIGKIHKTEHLNIICKGRVRVSTEDGPMEIEGPCVMTARPGVKKAVYALEDTWWINIHPTNETDLDEIEKDVIAKDYKDIEYLEDEL